MPTIVPKKQLRLLFKSGEVMTAFKRECTCPDFYIDRDAIAIVGFFTNEQVQMALTKYEAKIGIIAE